MKKVLMGVVTIALAGTLTACNNDNQEAQNQNETMNTRNVGFHGGNGGEQQGQQGEQMYEQERFQISLNPRGQSQYPNYRFNPARENGQQDGRQFNQQETQQNRGQQGNQEGQGGQAQQNNQNANLSEIQQEVVRLTNEERRNNGLSELKADGELTEVAQTKSEDMAEKGYFSHTSPTYGSPFDMMQEFGVDYQSAAENIASGQQSPEAVVDAWMNSPGHRKNILNGNLTHIGIGFDSDGNYWTQMFIQK
ncbi:CAP domain-containing protein [Sediminibacillus massiliensis]|uniref:CAP domain-containing protein n=1 Tax=Sediminibacillus massiliensis TaxID=1926277 RepID=UPI00098881D0|nr:CAP domain-containing protein [Sediminibacillus massiliensis]